MTRAEILDLAKEITRGKREEDYGSPENSFFSIACMWSAYLESKLGESVPIEPHDVAAMMSLLKIVRISNGHGKADNWIDLAGYAACGGEIATEDTTQDNNEDDES